VSDQPTAGGNVMPGQAAPVNPPIGAATSHPAGGGAIGLGVGAPGIDNFDRLVPAGFSPGADLGSTIFADTFDNRTVPKTKSDTAAWGTASDGHVWTGISAGWATNLPMGGIGVGGGFGYITIDGGDGGAPQLGGAASGFATKKHWLYQAQFRFRSSSAGQPYDDSRIGLTFGVAQEDITASFWLTRSDNVPTGEAFAVELRESGSEYGTFHFDYDEVYAMKWEHDVAANVCRLKVWPASSTEPSAWLIESDGGATLGPYDVGPDVASYGDRVDVHGRLTVGGPSNDDWVSIEVLSMNVNQMTGAQCASEPYGGWGVGPIGEWKVPADSVWAPAKHLFWVDGDCGVGRVSGDENPCAPIAGLANFGGSLIGVNFEQCSWPLELLIDWTIESDWTPEIDETLYGPPPQTYNGDYFEWWWRLEQAGHEYYDQFVPFNSRRYNQIEFEQWVNGYYVSPFSGSVSADYIASQVSVDSEINAARQWIEHNDYWALATPWNYVPFRQRVLVQQDGTVLFRWWKASNPEPSGWSGQGFQPVGGFSDEGFGHLFFYPISYNWFSRLQRMKVCRLEFVQGLCGAPIPLRGSGGWPNTG
jgi:hypothetical protein